MPANVSKIEPADVLLGWASAERTKTDRFKAVLSGQGCLSHVPEEADLAGLLAHRHFILGFFVLNTTEWFSADLTRTELENARTMNMNDVPTLAPSRLLVDLAKVSSYKVHNFDPAKAVGRPVVVAAGQGQQVCLIDGYNRCCEILRNHPGIQSVSVYLGVCPRLPSWRFF